MGPHTGGAELGVYTLIGQTWKSENIAQNSSTKRILRHSQGFLSEWNEWSVRGVGGKRQEAEEMAHPVFNLDLSIHALVEITINCPGSHSQIREA